MSQDPGQQGLGLRMDPYRNCGLFADHYLAERIGEVPGWTSPPGIAAAHAAITSIYRQSAALFGAATNEAQTEDEFIRPVLDVLWGSDTYQVQPVIPNADQSRRPDYALFLSAEDKSEAAAKQGNAGYWARVPCLADAKRWASSLDKQSGAENPSAQITNYLYRSKVRWGILTNGRHWRLYELERSRQGGIFLEVDLADAIEGGDSGAFRWFYAFFRRGAHEPDQNGVTFLDHVFDGSIRYAEEVGARLKDHVHESLLVLMDGFLSHEYNLFDRYDPARVARVHEVSLIVLYRLLFVLYSEHRGLFGGAGSLYDGYSLRRIHEQIKDQERRRTDYLRRSMALWHRLLSLFSLVDQGDVEAGLPAYNGGLFSPVRHPEIGRPPDGVQWGWAIGDPYIATVVDRLSAEPKVNAWTPQRNIDYSSLDVQHLGSIYEGLLELHPKVQDDGTLVLQNGHGERKATGSFYTPKFVVDYLVQATLAPSMDAAARAVAAARPEVDREIARLDLQRAEWSRLAASGDIGAANQVRSIERSIESQRHRLLEPYLSLRVLDPAMGSGHFLVGAADYVSLAMATDPCLLAPTDAGDEPPQAYYKRLVVQRCLYGVDINPLAVELAKLSLWLHTVSQARALSFLDHHLRCGNSLVGARVEPNLTHAPPSFSAAGKRLNGSTNGQLVLGFAEALTATHLRSLLDVFKHITEDPGGTAELEHHKDALYRAMDADRDRFRAVANVWIAPYFGVPVSEEQYEGAVGALRATVDEWASLEAEEWFAEAQRVASKWRAFHWELEFPEVFFAPTGLKPAAERGFDVVIGNPPYVRQEELTPLKPFLAGEFDSYHGVADLYLYFYEQGIRLQRAAGRLGFISSGTFARANFAVPFRRLLPSLAGIEAIVDLGENQPFPGAEMVRPSIVILERGRAEKPFRSLFVAGEVPANLDAALAEAGVDCEPSALAQSEWTFHPAGHAHLLTKLMAAGRPLAEVVEGRMYRGVLTGLNEAFIVDTATRGRLVAEDPGCAEVLKPVLRGEDLRPWYQEDEGRWLVFARRGIDIERYPSVLRHLEGFREQLEPKPATWDDRKPWPGRKPGTYAWYEIQDSVDYYEAFDGPKLFWPDISKLPRFSSGEPGVYIGNTGYIVSGAEPWLLGMLQSRAIWFAVSQVAQPLRLRAGLWQYRLIDQYMRRVPIPEPSPADRAAIGALAAAITEEARARYALHRAARHRIEADLGGEGRRLNQKLTAWWSLDFAGLRTELRKAVGADIPVADRDQWEEWLAEQRAAHGRHTAAIVERETELNERVYRLFALSHDEVRLIEESTKYRYGEV